MKDFIIHSRSYIMPKEKVYTNNWNIGLLSYYADRNFIWLESFNDLNDALKRQDSNWFFCFVQHEKEPLYTFLKSRYEIVDYFVSDFYSVVVFDLRKRVRRKHG